MSSGAKDLPAVLQRYAMERELLAVVVGGKSAIDMLRLRAANAEEAYRFLQRYGFNLQVLSQRAALERLRSDAIGFCRGVLLAACGDVDVPARFDGMDPLEIMILASRATHTRPGVGEDKTAQLESAWACSLLRVMHTFAHAENYFQLAYYQEIRSAILQRFIEQVHVADDGTQVLVGRSCDVPLLRFEVKEAKPIRSVVLKLLQKEENVAYDLFDHIGVRIVVERPVDALFVVRALVEEHTVVFPNIKPTRSRNTLIDIEALAAHVETMAEALAAGAIDEAAALQSVALFASPPETTAQTEWNRHSSANYNSIQFTCRQLIRLPNPLYERLERARDVALATLEGPALATMLASLDTVGVDREIQFFFPYEVQIMDRAANEAASVGRASYGEYKERQVEAVRQRVLGRVLELMAVPASARERRRLRTTAELRTLREMIAEAECGEG